MEQMTLKGLGDTVYWPDLIYTLTAQIPHIERYGDDIEIS